MSDTNDTPSDDEFGFDDAYQLRLDIAKHAFGVDISLYAMTEPHRVLEEIAAGEMTLHESPAEFRRIAEEAMPIVEANATATGKTGGLENVRYMMEHVEERHGPSVLRERRLAQQILNCKNGEDLSGAVEQR